MNNTYLLKKHYLFKQIHNPENTYLGVTQNTVVFAYLYE